MSDAPIRPQQYWTAKESGRLKSSSRIQVISIIGDEVLIERYYTGGGRKPHHKKDRITIKGLRRFYTLTHQQETLL